MSEARASFTCPECGRTSYHMDDARHRHCVACHKFFPVEHPAMATRPDEHWRIAQARIDVAQALRLLDKGAAAYPAARTLLALAADGVGKVIAPAHEA